MLLTVLYENQQHAFTEHSLGFAPDGTKSVSSVSESTTSRGVIEQLTPLLVCTGCLWS